VIANIRGGGEYGEDCTERYAHQEAEHFSTIFAACAKWLIDQRYTNPKRLAVEAAATAGC